jgi:K(+)-stimulated pyrophosphate-energized sodium pump
VGDSETVPVRLAIAVVAALIIAGAVYISKRRPVAIGDAEPEPVKAETVNA